jgi:hypothetical protein
MLRAFLHGKARRFLEESESHRSTPVGYKLTEDTLTALVFSRLSYLPVTLWWPILQALVKPAGELPDVVGGLDDIRFWPSWTLSAEFSTHFGNQYKEPDVFLRFPGLELIVEAKREDGYSTQYSQQLAAEYLAYLNSGVESPPVRCILLAVGGFAGLTHHRAKEFQASIRKELADVSLDVTPPIVVAAEWTEILTAFLRMLDSPHIEAHTRNILEDLCAGMRLHGIVPRQWLNDFPFQNKAFGEVRLLSFNSFGQFIQDQPKKPLLDSIPHFHGIEEKNLDVIQHWTV